MAIDFRSLGSNIGSNIGSGFGNISNAVQSADSGLRLMGERQQGQMRQVGQQSPFSQNNIAQILQQQLGSGSRPLGFGVGQNMQNPQQMELARNAFGSGYDLNMNMGDNKRSWSQVGSDLMSDPQLLNVLGAGAVSGIQGGAAGAAGGPLGALTGAAGGMASSPAFWSALAGLGSSQAGMAGYDNVSNLLGVANQAGLIGSKEVDPLGTAFAQGPVQGLLGMLAGSQAQKSGQSGNKFMKPIKNQAGNIASILNFGSR